MQVLSLKDVEFAYSGLAELSAAESYTFTQILIKISNIMTKECVIHLGARTVNF